MQRVTIYVVGLNHCFGLRTKDWCRYYWLEVQRLAETLIRPNQRLIAVRYFSSRISGRPENVDKRKRQATYLDALKVLPEPTSTTGTICQRHNSAIDSGILGHPKRR